MTKTLPYSESACSTKACQTDTIIKWVIIALVVIGVVLLILYLTGNLNGIARKIRGLISKKEVAPPVEKKNPEPESGVSSFRIEKTSWTDSGEEPQEWAMIVSHNSGPINDMKKVFAKGSKFIIEGHPETIFTVVRSSTGKRDPSSGLIIYSTPFVDNIKNGLVVIPQ